MAQYGAELRRRALARQLELEWERAGGFGRGQQGVAMEREFEGRVGLCEDY